MQPEQCNERRTIYRRKSKGKYHPNLSATSPTRKASILGVRGLLELQKLRETRSLTMTWNPYESIQRAAGRWFSKRYIAGGRYACYNQTADEIRRGIASERRTGFDWLLFQVMLSDQARIDAYRSDILQTVLGKKVLEIGPGPEALLSRMALEAGAESVVSVEGDPWVAERAERLLGSTHREGRWRIIPKLSTELTAEDVDGVTHFDVLLLEVYDSIACQEHVVETINDLKERGFSFDAVISRGYESWIGPASAPVAEPLWRYERALLGWGAGSTRNVGRQLRQRRSTLHGDMKLIESLRLAPPKMWQTADFESLADVRTEPELSFDIDSPERYRGFLIHNRFLFHTGVLDTAATSTHWGVYFVPLQLNVRDTKSITLHTSVRDSAQPSSFTLQAEAAGEVSAVQSF